MFILPSRDEPDSIYRPSLGCIGKTSVEGKIKNKFHMSPRTENMESYGKLCRERATKSMCKNKQIQVLIENNCLYHCIFTYKNDHVCIFFWTRSLITPPECICGQHRELQPPRELLYLSLPLKTHITPLLFFFSYRCEKYKSLLCIIRKRRK